MSREGLLVSDAFALLARLCEGFGWRDGLDIALVAAMLYYLLRAVRESRTFQMLRGLVILLVAALIARKLSLPTTTWLLNSLILLWAIGLVVTFQPELRRLIAALAEHVFLKSLFPEPELLSGEVSAASSALAQRRWGGLIVIERDTSLAGLVDSGVMVQGVLRQDLLVTIFTPGSPMHDGAAVIRGDQIYAAGCMLPMSEAKGHSQRPHGMRHRAAMGITEQTDALAVVISEESGQISLAMNGELTPPLDGDTLRDMLTLNVGRGRRR